MQEGGWIANSTIDGNIATNAYAKGGGGVLFYNEGGRVNSSTLSANTSTNSGGAYSHQSTYIDPGNIGSVSHSILWNNSPTASGSWDAGNNETVDPSTVSSAPGATLSIPSFASIASSRSTTFKYGLNSNLLKRELPNNAVEFRTYDALNRLSANTNTSVSSVYSVVYQHDAVGNLRQMDDSVSGLHTIPETCTWNWAYDDAYRLLSETVDDASSFVSRTEFDWDPAGNRTEMRKYTGGSLTSTTTYKPASPLNQMTGWTCGETNALYVYDANGNRDNKFITVGGTTSPSSYSYDEDNRLISVTTRETEIPKTYSFAYDYRTRRITRETPTEKTVHVFDGGLSVQEYDASSSLQPQVSNLLTESIRGEGMGGGVGGMVYSIRNGQIEASHSNHRGDVIARTDNAGDLTWFARYYAYGTRFDEVGATHDRQRGNTKDEEEPLGLSNQGMRWEDLEHGVWLSRDPAGYIDGPNLYLYVHCNPITGFDPLGLETTYRFVGWKQMGRNTVQFGKDVGKAVGGMVAGMAKRGLAAATDPVGAVVDDAKAVVGKAGQFVSNPASVIAEADAQVANMTPGEYFTAIAPGALMASGVGTPKSMPKAVPKGTPPALKPGAKPPPLSQNAKPKEAYNRRKHYGNTPSEADRKAMGAGADEVVDHDPPLVKRYYDGDPARGEKPGYSMTDAERRKSAQDRSRMKPQAKQESNKQGGKMSQYSKKKKKENGL